MEENTPETTEENDQIVINTVAYPTAKEQVVSYAIAMTATAAMIGVVAGTAALVEKVSEVKYNRRRAKERKASEKLEAAEAEKE